MHTALQLNMGTELPMAILVTKGFYLPSRIPLTKDQIEEIVNTLKSLR